MPLNLDHRPALMRKPAAKPAASAPHRFTARVQALAKGRALLDIYGDIGQGGVEAGGVLGALRSADVETIEIRINSQGGNAWDGLAIYNDLRLMTAARDVLITGIAGSAASIIAMAGDTICMADGAFIFIHNSWIDGAGDASFHEQIAAELRQADAAMSRIYAARTGIPEDQIRALMAAETLLTSAEALDLGFCDEIISLDGSPNASAALRQPHSAVVQPQSSGRAADDLLDIAAGLRSLVDIRRSKRD
jgi:ATP-dependent Clp protease, protease subunit